jgi:hypothetical protein
MQPRLSGFISKFFFEIVPATIASAIAGYVFSHLGIAPTSPPQAVVASPVSEETLKMVHDDHEAFVGYLKKTTANRPEGNLAAQQAEARLKQEEQSAALALRQAKEAEAKALVAAKRAAVKPAPQVAAKTPVPMQLAPAEAPLGQIVVARPSIPAPAQPAPAPAQPIIVVPPAPQVAAAPPESAPSSGGWFSAGAPPRPPGTLPQQNFSNASDLIGPGG